MRTLIAVVALGLSAPAAAEKLAAECRASDSWDPATGPSWNGWSPNVENTRFQSGASAKLTKESVSRLKLKWAFGFAKDSEAWAQPSIVGGRLFTGSAGGTVYALDAKTACVHWSFKAEAGVRGAVSIGALGGGEPKRYGAFFGDVRGIVYALDAATGKRLWAKRVEDHAYAKLTGSLRYFEGRLYVPVSSSEETAAADPRYPCCTFRGSVVALDARDGSIVWKTYAIHDPPQLTGTRSDGAKTWAPSGAAIWSAPTIDVRRKALYAATGNSYSAPAAPTSDAVLGIEIGTGRVSWHAQATSSDVFNFSCSPGAAASCEAPGGPDFDFGSSPVLTSAGGRRLLIAGQKSGVVTALDPEREGAVVWRARIGKGGRLGGIQWGMAADGEKIYAALSDAAFRKDAEGEEELDPSGGGGLFALSLSSGGVVWRAPAARCGDRLRCSPAQAAAVTAIPGVVFSGAMDGHIRAYSAEDGRVLWDYDTARKFETVNGVPARGGTLDAAGAAVVDGMVYVESGYFLWGGMPGNVLLAFSLDGS